MKKLRDLKERLFLKLLVNPTMADVAAVLACVAVALTFYFLTTL